MIINVCDFFFLSRVLKWDNILEKLHERVFGSVVVVAFQIAFRAEIHANDIFLFFKNHF
jgi:hypothetical protein